MLAGDRMSAASPSIPAALDPARYIHARRWASYWHQLRETADLAPDSVLEVGVGTGVFAAILARLFRRTAAIDIDAALDPDCVGSVERLPFADGAFDVVTCFQVLEHLPYERFAGCVGELARVARRAVVISLPDTTRCWRVGVTLPRLGSRGVLINVPWSRPPVHEYDGSHHWEVGAAGYPAARIRADLVACGLAVTREFRAFDNPYHRFLVCRHPR